MTTPSDFYARAVSGTPSLSTEGGASGYFSAPQEGLDPNLFDGQEMYPYIRHWINTTLYGELTKMGLKRPGEWVHIWVAGSGASYQWAADRGNGDLDVLFGVDYPVFLRCNQDWSGRPEDQLADWVNQRLKSELWPRTAHQVIGKQPYEVTFYLNPSIGRDITSINPYAAYNTRGNKWSVSPTRPDVAAYPSAWFDAAGRDTKTAQHLIDTHNRLHQELDALVPGSPSWHSKGADIRRNAEQADALFTEIHEGRHDAFKPGGHGYGDWHNFRWQQGKASGAIAGLKGLRDFAHAAQEAGDQELYGGPIAGAHEAIQHAAFVNQARPGLR